MREQDIGAHSYSHSNTSLMSFVGITVLESMYKGTRHIGFCDGMSLE